MTTNHEKIVAELARYGVQLPPGFTADKLLVVVQNEAVTEHLSIPLPTNLPNELYPLEAREVLRKIEKLAEFARDGLLITPSGAHGFKVSWARESDRPWVFVHGNSLALAVDRAVEVSKCPIE